MTKEARSHVDDLRGASRLVIEATEAVTGVVEAMHRTIAGGPEVLGRPLERPVRGITDRSPWPFPHRTGGSPSGPATWLS